MNEVRPNRDYAVVDFQVGLGDTAVAVHLTLATEAGLAAGHGEQIIVRLTPEMAKALGRHLREASKAAALGKSPSRQRQ